MDLFAHCVFSSKSYERLAWMSCAWFIRRLDGDAGLDFAVGAFMSIRNRTGKKELGYAVVAVLTLVKIGP